MPRLTLPMPTHIGAPLSPILRKINVLIIGLIVQFPYLLVGCVFQTKYFDSGDYAMAKAKGGTAMKQSAVAGVAPPELTTGEEIPTPENAHPRKAANRLSKLVSMS